MQSNTTIKALTTGQRVAVLLKGGGRVVGVVTGKTSGRLEVTTFTDHVLPLRRDAIEAIRTLG